MTQTQTATVRYTGYNCETGETNFAAPASFTDMPPIPLANLFNAAPDMKALLRRIIEAGDKMPSMSEADHIDFTDDGLIDLDNATDEARSLLARIEGDNA
jgi:hypothetical protein